MTSTKRGVETRVSLRRNQTRWGSTGWRLPDLTQSALQVLPRQLAVHVEIEVLESLAAGLEMPSNRVADLNAATVIRVDDSAPSDARLTQM